MVAFEQTMVAFELISPLAPDECMAQLREAVDREGVFPFYVSPGARPVLGRVAGQSVRLSKRVYWTNTVPAILVGTLKEGKGGTIFSGEVGVPQYFYVMWVLWCLGAVVFGVIMFFASVWQLLGLPGGPRIAVMLPPQPLAIFQALVLPVFGIGSFRCWLWLVSKQERFLVDFVEGIICKSSTNDKSKEMYNEDFTLI
jgi:hypothetical protein